MKGKIILDIFFVFLWGSNPRTLNCFRLPHLRASSLALYQLSYRSLVVHYLMSWTKGRIQRVGFEPTKRNGLQYEYLKYLLVAISARHPQFRHTTNLRTEILL